ncbi:phospholipase ABHD3-like [Eriocheir sinensis]|uniref:phospholipase ABHD3-like n=1 Tax=Eriocheir sinensis TaxID=95602 RepID=UPI0021C6B74F|nr:phospholipase ABHD3-like [Eriocheir sinensis]XP_050711952.1 phospholipase ABHD3-like [Eriocheir sinensis]
MEWYYSDWQRTVVGLTLGAGCLLYYLLDAAKVPLVACRRGAWRGFLEQHLTILQERYWPTPWCYESLCQTIMASVLRARLPDIDYRREVVGLKDGGQVSLDWLEAEGVAKGPAGLVLVLPGLTGSSQSEYVKGVVLEIQRAGVTSVVLNNRGMGGLTLLTTRTYCAANSDDLEAALKYLKETRNGAPIVVIGISLGGLITGNYLATRGEAAKDTVAAAAVVSVPWNMVEGLRRMERPVCNLLLNRYLCSCLCELADSFSYQLAGGEHDWNLDDVMKSKTMREFDTRFTARQFGFRDAEDYYRSSSLHDHLHRVRVPLLCLNAADDPFQPVSLLPLDAAKMSSHVALVVTSRGGHIGFMEGLFPSRAYYSDRLLTQFVTSALDNPEGLEKVTMEAGQWMTSNGCK